MKAKNVVLVMSGKGGVGKTTVAVNLGVGLSQKGKRVGLLDADIHGPNLPGMLGRNDDKIYSTEDKKIVPLQVEPTLFMVSVGFIVDTASSVIWRGPMKHNVLKQFIEDVEWGDLDYLVVDFPPGTGDECISAVQLLGSVTGTVIVATPQKVSVGDSIRSIDFCRQLEVPVAGVIENMSGGIFGGDTLAEVAKEYDVPYLGKVTMDASVTASAEKGEPLVKGDGTQAKEMMDIVNKVQAFCEGDE